MRINKHDTQGTKPLLGKGELGYDDYTAGGDVGRVYVGTGSENIALAEKSEIDSHVNRVDNPHNVTKTQVGLGNVDNTADSVKNVLSATKWTTARTITLSGDVAGSVSMDGTANVSITTTVQPNSVALGTDTTGNYVAGATAGTGITVSGTAGEGWSPTIAITNVGTAGTYTKVTTNAQGQVTSGTTLSATDIPVLDASKITTGTIDAARLPSFVDDVLEYANLAGFPATGETGKIYIALDTNKTYRWSGSVYVYITSGAVDSVNGQTGVVTITDITGNAGTATKLQTTRNIVLTGDVTGNVNFDGSADVSITATIAANSVALGTDTTGNYVAGATAGTGISISGTAGEGWSPTITNTAPNVTTDISITHNASSVVVNSSDGLDGTINAATSILAGIMTAADKTKLDGIATGATANTGTVTSIATTGAITGGTITTTGTISHSTADGFLHVPATGTTNNGKVLTAGATAGSLSWTTIPAGITDHTLLSNIGTNTHAQIDTALTRLANTSGTNTGDNAVNSNYENDYRASNFVAGTNYLVPNGSAAALTNFPILNQNTSGNAGTATKLQTSRNIALAGAIVGSVNFDGSADVNISTTLGAQSFIQSSGLSTSWGGTNDINTGAVNVSMGTSSSATWLISGTSGGVFRSGIQSLDSNGTLRLYSNSNYIEINGNQISGNISTASALATGRTIGMTGDVTWTSASFDGTGNVTGAATLSNSGVTSGSYSKVTVDAKGRVTAGLTPTMEDIPDATFKRSAKAATTANITLSAPQTIDGIALVAGDRVLVKDQTTTSQNGIYIVQSAAWTRALDADTSSKIASALVAVDSGTVNGGKLFDNDFKTTDTLGTTAMLWASNLDSGYLSSSIPIVAGTGSAGTAVTISRSDHVHPAQTTITGNAGTATALQTGRTIGMTGDVTYTSGSFNGSANVTGTATLATVTDSGTGTFKKITVDTKGRVTGTAAVAQSDITGLLGAGSITNTMLANSAVANLSGTNTGDETTATIKTKLGISTLSGSNTGDQTITLTGDVTGTGTGSFATTLASVGTAGTYTKVTTDAKGRITSGTTLSAGDVPSLDWSKITTGKPTTIAGYSISDAYTKTEVDGLLQGLKAKASVIVATTANITLSGTQTIDDVAVTAGQRVLVKNQTTASQNGIYVCSASAWSRSTDADTSTDIMSAYVFVEQGTANQDTAWVMNTDSVVLDTTSLTWVKFAGSGAYAATSHTHSAADITSGTLAVTVGGTGTTSSTGTGSVVLSTSPTLVTPNIGVASGTSFNSITGLSSTTPNMDGVASIGTSTTVARADHVHPAQTTITGNAGTATKLQTARTISLTGDVTGNVNFDGSANVSITATVADDSHNHVISNVDGLQTALDSKANQATTYTKTEVDTIVGDINSALDTINGEVI